MAKYNYRKAIVSDLKDWIKDAVDNLDELKDDDMPDWIYDEVWAEDSVTGNGLSFYADEDTCSEYLSGNYDLVYEAMNTFGYDDINTLIDQYKNQSLARYFDCTVRCYLLSECIGIAIEELVK